MLKESTASLSSTRGASEGAPTNAIASPSADTNVVDVICQRLVDGHSLREICRDEAMPSRSTVFRWLAKDEDFRRLYASARELQADVMVEEILEIADDSRNDYVMRMIGEEAVEVPDHEHINRSRLRIDARKWLMAKMAPKKYGEKLELAHSGSIARAQDLSDDELAAIVAAGAGS
jgi:hypothetical protein